ncbi:MAG TPA: hypothetical protein V6C78_04345 [Crinalium sp.]
MGFEVPETWRSLLTGAGENLVGDEASIPLGFWDASKEGDRS